MKHDMKAAFNPAYPWHQKDAGAGVTPEVKKLFDDLQTGFKSFREKNDEALKELKDKGVTDVVLKEHVDRINDTVTKLQTRLDQQTLEAKRPSIKGTNGFERTLTEDEVKQKSLFNGYIRKGKHEAELEQIESKSLAVGSNPDGGYLVPVEMETSLTRIITDVSPIRQYAQVITIGTALYEKPVNLTGANSGWVGETESRPQTNTPKLAKLSFPVHELYAMPAATQTLLDDANVNIEQWLNDEVRIEFARAEGAAFTRGDGVAKPMGFMSYNKVDDTTYSWGNIGFIGTGGAGFAADPNGPDDFIDTLYALKAAYRSNGKWAMARKTVAAVRQFQDSQGQYMWQPSIQVGQPATILGYPIFEAEDMDAIGAGNYPVAFADWASAYLIVDRIGIRVLRDPFSSKPYVLFYTTKRVGGGIQNYEAIKLIKCA